MRGLQPTVGIVWIGAAPLLLSWGLGTSHPLLDWASVPAALVLALPAWLGPLGLLVAVLAAAFQFRSDVIWRPFALVGGLALLAPVLAAARPLPWVALGMGGLLLTRGADDGAGEDAPGAWSVPAGATPWLGAGAWALASLAPPAGDGLLLSGAVDALSRLASVLPGAGAELPAAGLLGILALFLSRRRAPCRWGAALGAVLALAVTATFGSRSAWASSALFGALVGAWPIPLRGPSHRVLVPLVTLCALASLRLGMTERWNCAAARSLGEASFLSDASDLRALAVVPGNLPFLVILDDEGAELRRLGTTGLLNETRALDPAGGLLVSSGGASPFVRLVARGEDLVAEWWEASVLERTIQRVLPGGCDPVDGWLPMPASRVRVACSDGRVLEFGLKEGDEVTLLERSVARTLLGGAESVLRSGALSRLHLDGERSSFAGSWPAGLAQGPFQLLVSRGPVGQVEIRGVRASAGSESVGSLGLAETEVQDRVRVGAWPGKVSWSGWQKSFYVTSPVGGRAWLVDPEVTWHQASALLGSPPRQVVVDPSSGTLFGVNRCGLFEVRLRSTFPWRSTGDVEEEESDAGLETSESKGAAP